MIEKLFEKTLIVFSYKLRCSVFNDFPTKLLILFSKNAFFETIFLIASDFWTFFAKILLQLLSICGIDYQPQKLT